MANNTADPQTSDFKRPEEETGHLWRGLQDLGGGGGRSYLISGGSGGRRLRLLENLAAEARARQIRVAVFTAYDRNFDGRPLAAKPIREFSSYSKSPGSNGSKNGIKQIHSRSDVRRPSEWLLSSSKKQSHSIEWSNWARFPSALNPAAGSNPILLIIEEIHEADLNIAESIAATAREGLIRGIMIVATCPSLGRVMRASSLALAEFAGTAVHIQLRDANEEGQRQIPDLAASNRLERHAGNGKSNFDLVPPPLHALTNSRGPQLLKRADDRQVQKEKPHHSENSDPPRNARHTLAAHPTSAANFMRQEAIVNGADYSIAIGAPDLRERCARLIERGETESRKGANDAAENSLREAAILAEQMRDTAFLTRIVLALPAWHWPGPGEANALALLLAQRGLVIEREDGGQRAILMSRLAAELSYAPSRQKESAELAACAMRHVTAGTDSCSELYVRLYRDQVLRLPGQLAERLENAEAISRLAIEAGDYAACCIASLGKVTALMALGNMAEAERAAEFAVGIMPASQVQFHHGLSAAYRAHRAVMDGRLADAEQEFDQCRALAQASKYPYLLDASWPAMLMPFAERERLAELEGLAEDTFQRRRSTLVYGALLSWLKAQMGRRADALFLLEQFAADEFADLAASPGCMAGIAALAGACTALNLRDFAAALYERLLPWAEFNVTLNAVASFGSAERYLGGLALMLDRLDEAIFHFERSYRTDRRSGMRPWAIYSALDLAAALAQRGRAEDRDQALKLVSPLGSETSIANMKRASARLNSIRELLSSGSVTVWKSNGGTDANIPEMIVPHADESVNGFLHSPAQEEASAEPGGARDSSGHASRERAAIFRRNGEYWQAGYEGHISSFRHRRGLELIAFLVRHPHREFFALELAHEGGAAPQGLALENGRVADGGAPVLDAEAKRSYRERLTEIRDELEELRAANEAERASRLEEEQDFLTRELASALGLFGRDRKFNSESERARKRVSIAIARAIRSISCHDAHFGHYLERSIKTGNLSCYIPDPGNPVRWKL